MILAQNRTALISIYLSAEQLSDRESTALYAAKELRYYLNRITCASFKYVRLKRATMLRGEYDPEAINRFFSDWRAYNLSRLDEWANIETSHRAFVEGKWRGVEYFEHRTGEKKEYF